MNGYKLPSYAEIKAMSKEHLEIELHILGMITPNADCSIKKFAEFINKKMLLKQLLSKYED